MKYVFSGFLTWFSPIGEISDVQSKSCIKHPSLVTGGRHRPPTVLLRPFVSVQNYCSLPGFLRYRDVVSQLIQVSLLSVPYGTPPKKDGDAAIISLQVSSQINTFYNIVYRCIRVARMEPL